MPVCPLAGTRERPGGLQARPGSTARLPSGSDRSAQPQSLALALPLAFFPLLPRRWSVDGAGGPRNTEENVVAETAEER